MECVECKVCFGKIPNLTNGLNYSDHEGVFAEFVIQPNKQGMISIIISYFRLGQ